MKGKRKASANPLLSEGVEGANEIDKKGSDGYDENREYQEETEGEGDEEEDEEEDVAEGEGHQEDEEEAVQEEEERVKLDEGFFEIEAIRRKRVRKGQLQYLIKWRGWPETANTWEPLENLQSCSDVIDAFEESLQSGKSSRKRKRKNTGLHGQPKKKQPRSYPTYDTVDIGIDVVDKTSPVAPLNNSAVGDFPATNFTSIGHDEDNGGDLNNFRTSKQTEENASMNGSDKFCERKEDQEYDPKLSELRGSMTTNEANADKITVHFQEGKASEVDDPTNGFPKVDYLEPDQNNRCTGAKRRKSGSVRRFKKESASCEPVFVQNSSNTSVGNGGFTSQIGIGNSWNNSSYKPLDDNSINPSPITKIVKPIGFSASVLDSEQDVLVTFVARRADGKEVIVDNRFLKANNPQLLINFYEQHLKYST